MQGGNVRLVIVGLVEVIWGLAGFCKEVKFTGGAVECTEGDEDCEASEKVRKTRSSEPEKNNIQQLKPTQWFGAFVSVVTFRHIFMN